MLLEKYCQMLARLDYWIRTQNTGTPNSLAQRLGISSRRLYDLLDYLRDLGGDVAYSRKRQTYYYKTPCKLVIQIYVEKDDSVL